MSKFEDMELFVHLVHHGSFTRTAEFTGIPKSTISRRISGLESRLGVQLLSRTTRKLNLTEVGANYLDGCEQLLQQAKELESETQQLNDEPSGTLTIFIPTVLLRLIWPVVMEMSNDYPELRFEAVNSEGRQEEQTRRRYDVMFHVDEPGDSSLYARRVATIQYDYFATPEYVKQAGYLEKPSDVDQHQIIFQSVSQSPNLFWRFQYQGELVLQTIDPHFKVQSPELGMELCLANKGIVLSPEFMAGPYIERGELVRVFRPGQELYGNIYAIYHSRRYQPAKVSVFLDKVCKYMEQFSSTG